MASISLLILCMQLVFVFNSVKLVQTKSWNPTYMDIHIRVNQLKCNAMLEDDKSLTIMRSTDQHQINDEKK